MRFLGVALIVSALFVTSGCTSKKQEPANTIHFPVPAKVKGLDPIFADDLYGGDEAGKAYEGLLQYNYLKRPYQLEGALAESMPEISADGKTYTFKLKKGVLFQDDPCFKDTQGKGRELTVDDVIYSWKRVADPKLSSPGWWIFDGKIVGFNQWQADASKAGTTDYAKPVEGLKKIDNYTLQVTLTQKNYQFLYGVAMTFAYVVPHEAVETYGATFINHAVGTGPFRLVSFNGSSKVVWDRNPTYRKEVYPSEGEPGDKEAGLLEDAGQPLPRADRFVT
jgi:ABC-type transport system substrate-binding protein